MDTHCVGPALPRERSYRIRLNERELRVLQRIIDYGANSVGEAIRHVIHEYGRFHNGLVIPHPEHYEAIMRGMAQAMKKKREG